VIDRRETRVRALEHELQVHQAELESQNEELRRALTDLEHARDRYLDLYDFAPSGYITLTSSGTIAELNLKAAALLREERARLTTQRFDSFVTPQDRDRWHRHFTRAMREGAPAGIEVGVLARDGAAFDAQLDCLPVRAEGQPALLRITLSDVSVRALAQRQLAARTAELAAARDEAERANRVKSIFLAAASHDLRQPLQTLSMLHGVLARGVTGPAMASPLRAFGEAVRAMDGLLAALLDINRLDSGAIRPSVAEFPLEKLLAPLRSELSIPAAAKGLDLDAPVATAWIRSDVELLAVVMRNLIANAIKYTRQGRVGVAARREGDRVALEVTDTGIGIAPDALGHIFDEFYQVDNPHRDRHRGVGLGLAIVRRVCALLGHVIEVRSEPRRGTTFSIVVPAAHAPASPAPPPKAPEAAPRARGGVKTVILHIEDDAGVAASLGMLLRVEGYRVVWAAGAEAALRLVTEQGLRPDLIITDYQLPDGRTGDEAAAAIFARLGSRPPTILLTGDISDDLRPRVQAVVDRILLKPTDVEALLREIGTLVAR
jgi:PAS domain S-box-containing protein